MRIHREGLRLVYSMWALLILSILVLWRFGDIDLTLWLIPYFLLTVFVSRFFRVPKRKINISPNHIVAPADGKVVGVEEVEWEGSTYIMVSIFMSIWNVHINWVPISGRVIKKIYYPGKFLMAVQPKASELNERSRTVIDSGHGQVIVTQVAGAVARRISTYHNENESVNQGDELGFIKFGSRVDVLMPLTFNPTIKNGQKVQGIETVIATID